MEQQVVEPVAVPEVVYVEEPRVMTYEPVATMAMPLPAAQPVMQMVQQPVMQPGYFQQQPLMQVAQQPYGNLPYM